MTLHDEREDHWKKVIDKAILMGDNPERSLLHVKIRTFTKRRREILPGDIFQWN